jgi:recombinase-like zinc beta ribbon protein
MGGRGAGREGKARGGATRAALSKHYLLTGFLRCGVCNWRMVAHTTIKKKPSGVHRRAWYYCPTSKTKGPSICTHGQRYRTDRLELRLQNRTDEAMHRTNLKRLTQRMNEALARATYAPTSAGYAVPSKRTCRGPRR